MIVIVDNGRDYSDHVIYFIEARTDAERAVIDAAIQLQLQLMNGHYTPRILGIMQREDLLIEPAALPEIAEIVGGVYDGNPELVALCRELAAAWERAGLDASKLPWSVAAAVK